MLLCFDSKLEKGHQVAFHLNSVCKINVQVSSYFLNECPNIW